MNLIEAVFGIVTLVLAVALVALTVRLVETVMPK